jgi:PHP family Zn ribbon phosphoesterase
MADRNAQSAFQPSACAEGKTQISLSVKEIYERLCPKCKKALKELIRDKLTDQMVEQMLAGSA